MVNSGYQAQDSRIFDYQLWPLPNSPLEARGPKVDLTPQSYYVAIGAAQTFGRFTDVTYCDLLSRHIGAPILNLGFSGAGPTFFSENEGLMALINASRGVIVQMLSGRSVSNSHFIVQRNQGLVKPASDPTAEPAFAETAYMAFVAKAPAEEKAALLAEIRLRYVAAMRRLLERIAPPKLLMYWSNRPPAYREGLANIQGFWAGFPHFVDAGVCEALRPFADDYIEIVTKRGLPQALYDKTTGEPVLMWPEDRFPNVALRYHNLYYPSPEMHQDAAEALKPKFAAPLVKRTAPHPRDVLLHVHIFKNAGTSIDRILRGYFGERWRAVDPAQPQDCYLERDILGIARDNPELSALSTHQFRFPLSAGADGLRFHPLVMLRHPIDRAFSVYNFERIPARQAASQSALTKAAATMSFPEFVEWSLAAPGRSATLSNYQTRHLSLRHNGAAVGDWGKPSNIVNLEQALETLRRVAAVGVVDEFALSAERFNDLFLPVFGPIGFGNVAYNRTRSQDEGLGAALAKIAEILGPTIYEQLTAANALDLQLYHFARRRLGLTDRI